jgi:hypothetical protein
MNRADVLGAEDVGEKRRHGREPAAVHREDGEQAASNSDPLRRAGQPGNQKKEPELRDEEHQIGVAAPDVIRARRPEESPPALNS